MSRTLFASILLVLGLVIGLGIGCNRYAMAVDGRTSTLDNDGHYIPATPYNTAPKEVRDVAWKHAKLAGLVGLTLVTGAGLLFYVDPKKKQKNEQMDRMWKRRAEAAEKYKAGLAKSKEVSKKVRGEGAGED